MANRTLQAVNTISPVVVPVMGSILSSGAGITSTAGGGFTASYIGAGRYRVTLTDRYVGFIGGQATLRRNAVTGDDKVVMLSDFGVTTPNAIEMLVWDIGGAALTDAPAGTAIDFCLWMDDSTLGPG